MVIGMICSHYSIPIIKIQSIVTIEKTMVHIMMSSRIMPFTKPMGCKSLRIHFQNQDAQEHS